MKMRTAVLISLALSISACASSSTSSTETAVSSQVPAELSPPEFQLRQVGGVGVAARHMTGNVPVQFLIEIRNPSSSWIELRRVQLETMGFGAYTIRPYSKPFDSRIESMDTTAVEMWAPSVAEDTVVGLNGPVTVRMTAEFRSEFGPFRRVIVTQVNDGGQPRIVR